jgi:hypothetical protein
MSTAAFLDTAHILALLNPRDTWHARAVAASEAGPQRMVTTEAILTEVADALSRPSHRRWALQAIDDLRADPDVSCVSVDASLFGRALEYYRARADKAWSLTDCISFVVMTEQGLSDALTTDVHFEQAGFRAVLRDPA